MLFADKPRTLFHEMFRYGLVAAIGLIVDFGGLIFLKEVVHLEYLVAASLSFIAALIVNYLLSSRWVFEQKRHQAIEFSLFLTVGLVGLGLNDLILWFLTSSLHIYYLTSKLIGTVIVFFWNFSGRKLIASL